MKILKLDRTGHTCIEENLETEFAELCSKGYAMFVNDEHIRRFEDVPQDAEILALAPLIGG